MTSTAGGQRTFNLLREVSDLQKGDIITKLFEWFTDRGETTQEALENVQCWHGVTNNDQKANVQAVQLKTVVNFRAVLEMTQDKGPIEDAELRSAGLMMRVDDRLSFPLFDEQLVTLCFGMAARAYLMRAPALAEYLATLGFLYEMFVHHDVPRNVFVEDGYTALTMTAPSQFQPFLATFLRNRRQLRTKRGLELILFSRVSCPCLDGAKAQLTNSRVCWFCDERKNRISMCGRCHMAKYCCVECQRADWKAGHKHQCFS